MTIFCWHFHFALLSLQFWFESSYWQLFKIVCGPWKGGTIPLACVCLVVMQFYAKAENWDGVCHLVCIDGKNRYEVKAAFELLKLTCHRICKIWLPTPQRVIPRYHSVQATIKSLVVVSNDSICFEVEKLVNKHQSQAFCRQLGSTFLKPSFEFN